MTLAPGLDAQAQREFARRAAAEGADLLELRTDLYAPDAVDAPALDAELPLLVAERGPPAPKVWREWAEILDVDVGGGAPVPDAPVLLASIHARAPLTTAEALQLWVGVGVPRGALLKHVEPLGPLDRAERLFQTQQALLERHGPLVAVLATGPLALPFRCLLAERNALDYLALDASWSAAPGQRLLADAVRESRRPRAAARRGILGTAIGGSASPRFHRQPFDRIDLAEDAPIGELVDALGAHYDGFAVTSPFKRRIAQHVGSPLPAVNALARREGRWVATNTDVEGARAVLDRLGGPREPVTVLGDGGVADALKMAAKPEGRALDVVRRGQLPRVVRGLAVWTWPPRLPLPPGLRFEGARVAVVAYGPGGRGVAEQIRALGGTPVRLGVAWFAAQARAQRVFWDTP